MKNNNDKLEELQEKEKYNKYQEDLAFAKELNILRNDFYYQTLNDENISLVDFLYKPIDMLSGDAYTARRVDEHNTFYLLVDGMGKGLSASLSSMMITSFVNHLIDKMIEHNSFSLDIIIKESMEYIQSILLDEEVLAIDYIFFDTFYNKLRYAKFAMPPFLLEDKDRNIIKLKSNNVPLSKWQLSYNIDEYDFTDIKKFLFYTDGLVENPTKDEDKTYAQFIDNDFKNSFTREEFKEKVFEKISTQEDDITLIYINKLDLNDNFLIAQKEFETSLDAVDKANEWYLEVCNNMNLHDTTKLYHASIVFTELFMNAYEHGNLGIDSKTKHNLLEEDIYFDTLLEKEKECDKIIKVSVYKVSNISSEYIITQIEDNGDGFDTKILSEIFRNARTFNGRGVFVSRKNSMGIYYNSKGNSVLYLSMV